MRDLQVQNSTCRKKPKTCLFFRGVVHFGFGMPCHKNNVHLSGLCLGYLHPPILVQQDLPVDHVRQNKDVKRIHIPSRTPSHSDLQGPRATSVYGMSISCQQASMPSTMKSLLTGRRKRSLTPLAIQENPLYRYVFFSISVFQLYYPRLHLVTGEMGTCMLVVIMLQDITVC